MNHKGEVKITDFGVSAVLASSMGQRDTFVGTYNYMAVCLATFLDVIYWSSDFPWWIYFFFLFIHYIFHWTLLVENSQDFFLSCWQPERISGDFYDFRSDIWSLGLVILECATGSFPYKQTENEEGPLSFYELLETIVEEPPPSVPEDQFSPELCSFISAW